MKKSIGVVFIGGYMIALWLFLSPPVYSGPMNLGGMEVLGAILLGLCGLAIALCISINHLLS